MPDSNPETSTFTAKAHYQHNYKVPIPFCFPVFGSGYGSAWIRIDFGRLDPDPNPEWQECATKMEKREEMSCFEVLDNLFMRAEGFFRSLDLLFYGGMRIS
jgi:hypothetical protein